MTIYLRIEDEAIQAAAFESFGCALCRAAASLLTEAVKGLPLAEASELVKAVERLLAEGNSSAFVWRPGRLGEFGVGAAPKRGTCRITPSHNPVAGKPEVIGNARIKTMNGR